MKNSKTKWQIFFERCVKQRLIDGTTQYFNKKKNIFFNSYRAKYRRREHWIWIQKPSKTKSY